jgi:hypothetical protein
MEYTKIHMEHLYELRYRILYVCNCLNKGGRPGHVDCQQNKAKV